MICHGEGQKSEYLHTNPLGDRAEPRRIVKCPVCGKDFALPTENIYKCKKTGRDVCSWSCVLATIDKGKKKEIPENCKKCVFLGIDNVCAVNNARKYRRCCGYFVER